MTICFRHPTFDFYSRSQACRKSMLQYGVMTAGLIVLAACHGSQAGNEGAQAVGNQADNAIASSPSVVPASYSSGEAIPSAAGAPTGITRAVPDFAIDAGFQPLGSQAVKDSIHAALRTGSTQRWQDGERSGYAVPSQATDARGCRSVRYTIDQEPARSFPVITACDANGGGAH